MLVLSHRGDCAGATENTMPAFDAAVRAGVDGIETDVHCTGDGTLVLHHDADVAGLAIASHTEAALQAAAGYDLPTVASCLDRYPGLLWNFELKSPAAAAPLLSLLRDVDAQRVVVSSFLHPAVARFGHEAECSAAVLVAHEPVVPWPMDAWLRHGIDTVVVYFGVLTEPAREAVATAGLSCWTYGPVTPADHARCRTLDLDAVITDWPARLR